MSDDVTAEIEGLEDLEQMLEQQTPRAARTAVRRATRAGGEIFQLEIEARAPRLTGFLASEIVIKSRASGVDDDSDATGAIVVRVGADPKAAQLVGGQREGKTLTFKNDPHYAGLEALFAEFGTKHESARPFMRPSFEAKKDEVLETFQTELRAELENLRK